MTAIQPLLYTPSVEVLQADEAETVAGLVEQLLKISTITFTDGGHALRSVHAKASGLLKAEMTVADGLPATLAQGLFARPGKYPVAMRLSTSPGDILPDSVSTPRGMALKIFNVEGERLPESEDARTQDFLLVTGKTFLVSDAKHFLSNLKLLASTTDKAESLKVALSAVLRATEGAIEALGGESGTLKALGGYPETHILGESFFSQVPIRYGDYIAKIGVVPVSPELAALTNAPLNLHDDPNALRAAVAAHFAAHGGAWEVRVQLCTDLDTMPIEDAAKAWPEDQSRYMTVARIDAAPQESWTDERYRAVDTAMAFSPWHGLSAHQPLGSIMRARRTAYQQSAQFRLTRNHCPFHEPHAAEFA